MFTTLAVVISVASVAPPPVSLESLLKEMTDRTVLARYPDPGYACAQSSSYDRVSTSPDDAKTWFANNDYNHFLRVEEIGDRKEWVLLDQPGPGAVVRIWSANPKGVLRFYLDGASEPVIEASMADLLSGKHPLIKEPIAHEAARGFNLYLPVPYAKSCKITSDRDGFYYHVNYRTYEPGTAVTTLSAEDLAGSGELIAAANEELRVGVPVPEAVAADRELSPGGEHVETLPRGSHAVTEITVALDAEDLEQATRSVVVVATFDGIETIWCPVGDFFGSGLGANEYHDLFRGVSKDGTFTCRWVMPYAEAASIKLVNLGSEPVRASLKAAVSERAWDDRSMHFYTRWRSEYPIRTAEAAGTSDFNYVTAKGRGVLVGDNLSLMNPVWNWWGEGDEKIWVDGESFPSHFGTGTEDYYGYAWCAAEKFVNAFHSQPRVDGERLKNNYGHSTVTRVRTLDAIPFRSSLQLDMEIWHWVECEIAYASTVYFYAMPGVTHNRPPDPASAAAPVPQPPPWPEPFAIEGAIELETLGVTKHTPGLTTTAQRMESFKPRTWSGETHLWVQAAKVGDFVELRIPCEPGKRVTVDLHATKSWDYGIVRFSLDGKPTGGDIDLFSGGEGQIGATGAIDLGVVETAGDFITLRAEVVGANEKAHGGRSFFGLDCVVLKPAQ